MCKNICNGFSLAAAPYLEIFAAFEILFYLQLAGVLRLLYHLVLSKAQKQS